ncbi:hypothetical protein [Streptomyces vinaceus]
MIIPLQGECGVVAGRPGEQTVRDDLAALQEKGDLLSRLEKLLPPPQD